MTPSMAAIVGREAHPGPWVMGVALIAVPAVLIGYLADVLEQALAVYLVAAVLIAALFLFWVRPRARRDLDAGTFVRSRGQFGISRINEGTDSIQAPDGTWMTVETDVIQAVSRLDQYRGEVDYAPRSEIVFEIRDLAGTTVWRHKRL